MALKKGDRIQLIGRAAAGPPDRRKKLGTVIRSWSEDTGTERLDVLFDGEDAPELGRMVSTYELSA